MKVQKIPFRSTRAFTEFFLKYMDGDPVLQSFYSRFPSPGNFAAQLNDKSGYPEASRRTLTDCLRRQYAKLPVTGDPVSTNIDSLLQKNTFTITTGHQLNIFTGPLYFIYKIVTVINACKKLKEQYPSYHFVPVYWMATEDHDYEEIKSFRLYGKKYTWTTKQQGAVGRFSTHELEGVLQQLPGDVTVFREAYQKNKLLSDAVRQYVNQLFGPEGLVVVDADDHELKKVLSPVMKEDVIAAMPFQLVKNANDDLEGHGLTPGVNPREINFFYLDNNVRNRIEKKGDDFIVVDTPLKFSQKEIDKVINETPEKLSPNVILRPLYQELILPNLAYVGGPAELVYWLQLKGLFSHFKVPFPILLPRNFALVIDKPVARKLAKTGLDIQDFFEEKNFLFNQWVSRNSTRDLSLGTAMRTLEKLLLEIEERAKQIDPGLGPMTGAESQRMQHTLERIEKKMLRAEKRHHSDRLRQIESVKDALFPSGGLQERTDNFLNFYQQDPDFIKRLLLYLDPFDFHFNVLTYHDEG